VVDLHGPHELDVRHRAIFVDMTSGAVGPEPWEFPGGGLAARDMAAVATKSGAVIHVGRRCVPICHRCPERSPMTAVARQGREEMTGRSALRCGAVVATDARPGQARVIDPGAHK